MKKYLVMIAAAAVLLWSCSSVPITGRKQLNLVSDSEVLASSLASYKEYMASAKVSSNTTQNATVTRVGKAIAAAERGLGTCWVCNFDADLCRRLFHLPDTLEPVAFLPLGYEAADHQPRPFQRKEIDELWLTVEN